MDRLRLNIPPVLSQVRNKFPIAALGLIEPMTTDTDLTLRNRNARLLERASAAQATGQSDVADRFTERAAELLDRVVSEELAVERRLKKNSDPAGPR
jgi:hypothetical protein